MCRGAVTLVSLCPLRHMRRPQASLLCLIRSLISYGRVDAEIMEGRNAISLLVEVAWYNKTRHLEMKLWGYSHMNKCSVIQTLRNFRLLTTFLVIFLENPY